MRFDRRKNNIRFNYRLNENKFTLIWIIILYQVQESTYEHWHNTK